MTPDLDSLPLGPHRLYFRDRRATEETLAEVFGGDDYVFRSERAEPYIIDGGANIGISVLYFRQRHPTSRIVAFEPDPVSLAVLRHNIAANGIEGVTVIDAALGADDGEGLLWGDHAVPDSRGFSLLPEWGRQGDGASGHPVRTVSLRSWLDQPCDFLKLDIEGAEYDVLASIADLLPRVEALCVECHEVRGLDRVPQTLRLLEAAGLCASIIDKDLLRFLPDHHLAWAREGGASLKVLRGRRDRHHHLPT